MKVSLQDVKPCSLVDAYQHCRGTCCMYYPDNSEVTQSNETLLSNWQKESWKTFKETSGYVRPEWVNK